MKTLNEIISTLNPNQRQAVEQIYGPVLVLAGPGTGKTHMLTTRVAHILDSDAGASPQNLLCLTFTESAAVEMRNRLQRWIGETAYQIKIMTFHGFCQWVIDDNPHIFNAKFGPREVADDLQKALIFRHIIKQQKWEYFHSIWDDFAHQRDFLSAVSDLKREHLTPSLLRELIPGEKERLEADPANFYKRKFKAFMPGDWKPEARAKIDDKVAKMTELADLWEAYEAELQKRGFYDFDDLINQVIAEMEQNQNLRFDLQERFQWILVDEYQDTNNSQNAILWQLTEGVDQPNIMAVGDDDQSIYRFQGASVANIRDFRERYPQRLEVTLTDNYRSHQHVLDAAYHSVAHNLERANQDKVLVGHKTQFLSREPGKIEMAALRSPMAQTSYLANTIKAHLEAGVPPHEIAILVRKNREIRELAADLPKFGIPIAAQIAQNIFENETVRQLLLMLQLLNDPKHDERLFDLLHADFLQFPPADLLQLSLERNRENPLITEILQKEHISLQIKDFINFFITARRDFHHARAVVVAEKFLYESGLAEFLTQQNRLNDWQCVRKFIAWMREQSHLSEIRALTLPGAELKALLDRVQLHLDLSIPIFPEPLPADARAIRLMTAHKSKGLEFEVVLIPSLEDRHWGNPRSFGGMPIPQISEQSFDENEEERRLFFVALTRAKSQLHLSYREEDFSGRDKTPSLFWHEIPETIASPLETDALESELQSLLPVFFRHEEKHLTQGEKELLQQRVQQFRWSASSLQTFLDCPRKFLYQYLYRFPRRPLPQLALGVALHQALERIFEQLKKSGTASLESLLHEYDSALRGQNLPTEDYEKWLSHGREILASYHQQKLLKFGQDYPHGFELEFDFTAYQPEVEGIRITGTMDKVVYLDEKHQHVKIVDYKSGKPRPIKPGEAYWRQLVFYGLLAEKAKGSEWIVESAEIEFLTPGENGQLGNRDLVITREAKDQVIAELKEAHQKLLALEFPMVPNPERDPEIEYWQHFGHTA